MKLISQKDAALANLPTLSDLSCDKDASYLPQIQLEIKFVNQGSMISLNDKLLEGIADETTTENGPLTQRTDVGSLAYSKQDSVSGQEKPYQSNCKKTEKQQNHKENSINTQLTNFQRLKLLVSTISNFTNHKFTKFLTHLSKTSTADKYIRLVYSIFKLYRALHLQNNLGLISKQLLTTRRILQWDIKYQLIKQLRDENLDGFDFGYKIFELIGNLLDFGSFWAGILAGKRKGLEDMAETMYSWQDDCYFYQCVIELMLAVKSLAQNIQIYFNQPYSQSKKFEYLYKASAMKERENELIKKLKKIKSRNSPTSTLNNQINKIFQCRIQQKIAQKQTQLQALQKSFDEWQKSERKKLQKDMIKSSLKIVKYLCDIRTSYNNFSWKGVGLDPVLGGGLSVGSSLIGMLLMWGF